MADNFPNLPGITVGIQDGNLRPETVPAGPAVVVLGTATKGPSKVETRLATAPSALSRFGLSGTLARGAIEVFQGGGDNVIAYRVLATEGKIEHIGDATGAAGYTIETVGEGSDILEKISVLYDNATDILKVYDVASGIVVYSNDPDALVDLGIVSVSGSKAVDNAVGSVGLQVAVQTDESAQVGLRTNDTTFTLAAGNNLSLLRFDETTKPFVAQFLSIFDTSVIKTGVQWATAAALPASTYAAGVLGVGATLTANANGVLAVDGGNPNAGHRILVKDQVAGAENGIYEVTDVGTAGTPFILTRVTDTDEAAEFTLRMVIAVDAGGVANGGTGFYLSSAGPYVVGTTALVFAECDPDPDNWIAEATLVTVVPSTRVITYAGTELPALAFPAGLSHSVRFISSTLPIRADKILTDRLFSSQATGLSAGVQPLLVTPGSDFNGLPKVVNDLGLTADADLAEVAPAKMNMYEALEDAFQALEASEFGGIVMPGVYLDDPALDGEAEGDTALPAEFLTVTSTITVAGKADRCIFRFANETARDAAVVKLVEAGRGGVWAQFTEIKGAALDDTFGYGHDEESLVRTARILNWAEETTVTDILVFFDRDISFSLSALAENDGVVVASEAPAVETFKTDQLFYHRSVEVDGQLRHLWYSETADEDGYVYHEVNFAYRLAKFCNDMTSNEVSVTGVIGVRPPSNHFNPAAIANWIGKSPVFDVDGNVSTNGTGLLGNKFVAGFLTAAPAQFSPGFKQTEDGELDDDVIMLDANGFEIDMGKFLSIVATWPVMTNAADTTGLGYINSGASLYAGLLASLPSWRGATAKPIGGRGIRLPAKLAKRHQNSLVGARFVLLDSRPENVIVVDAPSAALPTSDFTRNMTVRLTAEAAQICRNVARPFLGDPLGGVRRAALETALRKALSDLQRVSGGALESFDMSLTQSALDKRRGTAKLTLTLQVINELRKITVDVALTK